MTEQEFWTKFVYSRMSGAFLGGAALGVSNCRHTSLSLSLSLSLRLSVSTRCIDFPFPDSLSLSPFSPATQPDGTDDIFVKAAMEENDESMRTLRDANQLQSIDPDLNLTRFDHLPVPGYGSERQSNGMSCAVKVQTMYV
eukprot:TRINITY_DN845_c0_g3_i1.p1 TRINITY_DN845_c0_g3~~TRINITY_DN845_c0_g3_i1.p1  ORF type:complete len:140 (-),score=30.94 TRINITY_DN845_c0_g3_i1:216-635(-)